MSAGFSKPPPSRKPDEKYTGMEQQAIQAKREGKRMGVSKETVNGKEVVGLDEIAEPEPTVQPPEPLVAEAASSPQASRPRVTNEAIEQMAEAAFGPKPGQDSLEDQETDAGLGLGQTLCPNCSWDISKPKEYAASEEDKAEFVRAILGGRRFRKQIAFMDGRLTATFRSMTIQEEQIVQDQITQDTIADGAFGGLEWISLYRKYQLLFMLEAINYGGNIKEYPEVTRENYKCAPSDSLVKTASEAITKGWSTLIHAMLLRGCVAMNEIFNEMTARSEQPDFWRGLPVD